MVYRQLGLNSIQMDDVMGILLTSGSTGMPRAVMLTHRNIGSNIKCYSDFFGFFKDDSPDARNVRLLPRFAA